MPSNFSKIIWLCFITATLISPAAQSRAGPKVGSPEWKREFDRKSAKFERDFQAQDRRFEARAAASRKRHKALRKSRTSSSKRQSNGPKFDAAAAPSPLDCLLALRKAAAEATSFDQLLPYRSKVLRNNYHTSQGWDSTFDHLEFDKSLLSALYRVDNVYIKGDRAFIAVIRKTQNGGFPYHRGTFTMRGEGRRWRMEAYKSHSSWSGEPMHSKNKPDFPIYVDVYVKGRARARNQTAADLQPATLPVEESPEPTISAPAQPQPEN